MTDQTPRPGTGPQKRPVTIYRSEQVRDAAETRAVADRDARRADRDAQRAASAPPLAAPAPLRPARKRSATGGRIAAAGIGIAAMAGLVANMEITAGRAQAASPGSPASSASAASLVAQHAARNPHQAAVLGNLAVAKANQPIVLTPHAVVNTVSAPSSGGSYSGGSYSGASSSAAPAAAAPVASSGGSAP